MGKGGGNICFKTGEATDGEKRGLTALADKTPAQEASAPTTKELAPETPAPPATAPVDPPTPTPDAPAPEVADLPDVPEPAPTSPTAAEPAAATPISPASEDAETATPVKTTKIYVIFYSLYGHVYSLAKQIKEGIDAVEGCEATLFQVAETLSPQVLAKMHAPPKPDVPVITAAQLVEADGFVFGFGTRFGSIPAQFKAFFDSTGQLWQQGALVGKPAGFFTSTTSPAGGADITIFTSLTQIIPHGMIYVPIGYSYGPEMFDLSNVEGGSPYGAATLTTITGGRQPSEKELGLSKHQGSYFAKIAQKLQA